MKTEPNRILGNDWFFQDFDIKIYAKIKSELSKNIYCVM